VSQSSQEIVFVRDKLSQAYGYIEIDDNKVLYLGMELTMLSDQSIEVKQSGYISKLLENVDYQFKHPTPSTHDFFDTADDPSIDYSTKVTAYKSLIMSLMFLAIRTRPDTLKEVIFLSTFMTNPGPIAHHKLYHLVGYLRGTPSLGIRFKVLERKYADIDEAHDALI
jgi:hypothetical protein